MHHVRRGSGRPLLLIHGLGGSRRSWEPVLDALAAEREVIAVDLPGFGDTPPLAGEVSIAALADALVAFVDEQGLRGVDVAGTSMGARLALELARRGVVGTTVALDPGGFWNGWERRVFGASVWLSFHLVKRIQRLLPALLASPAGRTALLAQFSARPWALRAEVPLAELREFDRARSFLPALSSLVRGPAQEGGPTPGRVVLGWGRRDLVTLPRQAERARARFPQARIEWFDRSGHFPHWDEPAATARLILAETAG